MNNILTYLLVKRTFWDQLQEEFRDIVEIIEDFFLMIKEVTYDVLANSFGTEMTNLMIIAIGIIGLMIILITIINR